MMAALCDVPVAGAPGSLAAARDRSMSAKVRPAPNAPIFKNPRREIPSQNRCFVPQMVNIDPSPRCTDFPQGTIRLNATLQFANGQSRFCPASQIGHALKGGWKTQISIAKSQTSSKSQCRNYQKGEAWFWIWILEICLGFGFWSLGF